MCGFLKETIPRFSRGWCLAQQEAPRKGGCPILCALCKGWDTRQSVSRFVVSHPSQKARRMGHPEVCCTFGRGQTMLRFVPRGSLNHHLIRIEAPPPLSSRPDPDFLPRGTKDDLVCGFHQGKPHELCGTHRAQQEIRGSGGICSSLMSQIRWGEGHPALRLQADLANGPEHPLLTRGPFGIQAAPVPHRQRSFVLR